MKAMVDLFAGTRSVSSVFAERGWRTLSVEWDRRHPGIDWYADINGISAQDIVDRLGCVPDVVWASPPCQSYSVAAIGHHRRKDPATGVLAPVTDFAKASDALVEHTLGIIADLQEMYLRERERDKSKGGSDRMTFFIENPRAGLRTQRFMQGMPRYTVTYCKYGDTRMKPTDIWTNHPDPQFAPPCRNGDPCHDRAPRGTRQGTQGLKGAVERAVIPRAFCEHIADICEGNPSLSIGRTPTLEDFL